MKESKHIHCRFKEDTDFIFLTKDNTVCVENLRYTKLVGQTSGYSKVMSFPDMKSQKRKYKSRVGLQTSRYRTSDLVKFNGELVFNSFRTMDEETRKHYNHIKAEIKAREEGLKDYLQEKFMTQPFLKFEEVKKEIEPKDYERNTELINEVLK